MKIAHVVDSMEIGGAETIVAQLCHWQRDRGHVPLIYAHLRMGALGQRLIAEGFQVKIVGPAHLPQMLKLFTAEFRATDLDVVHCHNPTPTIYAAIPAKLAGIPRVISTRHSLVAPPYNKMQEIKFSIASRFCDSIIGICEATCQNIRRAPLAAKSRIRRIYNGAEELSLPKIPSNSDRIRLLYVGRMAAVKNHETLLRGLALAVQRHPSLYLTMVGDGPHRQVSEEFATKLQVTESVRFVGQQMDVAPYFADTDIFVMSSTSEGLPMSLLQSMSLGLPAIVTDAGGMAEVVRLSRSGVVVPRSDPESYAQALLELANNAQLRNYYAHNAREAYQRFFTLNAMARAYQQLYEGDASSGLTELSIPVQDS